MSSSSRSTKTAMFCCEWDKWEDNETPTEAGRQDEQPRNGSDQKKESEDEQRNASEDKRERYKGSYHCRGTVRIDKRIARGP